MKFNHQKMIVIGKRMQYPSLATVEQANIIQLGRWMRFLPTPGVIHSGTKEFGRKFTEESEIFYRISDRFESLGGWTPEVSKAVGLQS